MGSTGSRLNDYIQYSKTILLFVILEVRQYRLDPFVQRGGMRTIDSRSTLWHGALTPHRNCGGLLGASAWVYVVEWCPFLFLRVTLERPSHGLAAVEVCN